LVASSYQVYNDQILHPKQAFKEHKTMHRAHISTHFFFAHFFTLALHIQAALLWNSDSWAKYLMKQERSTKTIAKMVSLMAHVVTNATL
jgi:hypothetical protein